MSLGNKEIMARNIRHYMSINNVTRNDVCNAIGVKYTTFTDWINANAYPRIDKIELMANYFGCRKADLVEDKTSVDYALTLSNMEQTFIEDFRKADASKEQLKRILAYLTLLNHEGIDDVEKYLRMLSNSGEYNKRDDS